MTPPGWQESAGLLAVLGAALLAGLAVATLVASLSAPSPTVGPAGGVGPTQALGGLTAAPPSPQLQSASPVPSPTQLPDSSPTPTATPAAGGTARPDDPARPGPAEVVIAFYVAVATHDWETATALWSPDMQRRFPPDEYIVDRFADTQRIQVSGLDVVNVDRSAGTARVELTVIEYRTVGPSPQRFVGAWDLVRIDGRWLLDAPHF